MPRERVATKLLLEQSSATMPHDVPVRNAPASPFEATVVRPSELVSAQHERLLMQRNN
ncbi:MAG: hypothetical protein IPP88_03090 [Betaproteobacteria bacterium]|nr:hypothetical protein [Betaproteobacteria bacterium]